MAEAERGLNEAHIYTDVSLSEGVPRISFAWSGCAGTIN